MTPRRIIIVGSGPAGLTAAIYAARAGLAPLLFEGEAIANNDLPGGQLMTTTEVDNYPGFPLGVSGPELVASLRQQAERFGTEIVSRRVTALDLSRRPFTVATVDQSYETASIILSTGAKARMLDLPDIWSWLNRGLSTCATCDGFFFKGQDVAVVGGGDSSMEEAIYLSRLVRSVTVIVRRDQLRASNAMVERAKTIANIKWRWNSQIVAVDGGDRLASIMLTSTTKARAVSLAVSGLFIAIGHDPCSELVRGQLKLDAKGYIVTEPSSRATSVSGVFACGDVQDSHYRQAITSAGSGCEAALDAQRWLEQRVLQSEPTVMSR